MFKLILTVLLLLVMLLACAAPAAPAPQAAPTATVGPTKIKTTGKPIIISAQDRPGIVVKATDDGYEKVYALVGGDGLHQVSASTWQQILDILGW